MNTQAAPQAKPPKSRAGRLVAYLAYAVVASWSIGATITSVLVDLYGAPPQPGNVELSSGDQRWCVRTFNALWAELDTRMVLATQNGGTVDAAGDWQSFSDDWATRLADARSRCAGSPNPSMHQALASLQQLHQGYGEGVKVIGASHASHANRFRAALRSLLKPTPDSAATSP